jgi:hypothetical protein
METVRDEELGELIVFYCLKIHNIKKEDIEKDLDALVFETRNRFFIKFSRRR